MVKRKVELTDSFLAQLDQIETFLSSADAHFAYDDLLVQLRVSVIPNLRRFPRIGRKFLDYPPQSAEALAQLARLPQGAMDALREYLMGDYLILYTEINVTIYLLSIRHHRQLAFDFPSLWPESPPKL